MRHRYRTPSPPRSHPHYRQSFHPPHHRANEPTCSKFDWENLLSHKNESRHVLNANSNRDVVLSSSSSPHFNEDDFGFCRKTTTMSMENEMDPTRMKRSSTSYGLYENRASNCNLDNQTLFVRKESDRKRVMMVMDDDYDFIKQTHTYAAPDDVMRDRDLVYKSRHFDTNPKDFGADQLYGGRRREVGLEFKYGSDGRIQSSGDGFRRMPLSHDQGLYEVEPSLRRERHLSERDLDTRQRQQSFDVETPRHHHNTRFYNLDDANDNQVYHTTGQWIVEDDDEDDDDEDLSYQESLMEQSYGGRVGSRTNNDMMMMMTTNGNSNFNPHTSLSNRYNPELHQNHTRIASPRRRDIKSRLEFPVNVKQRLGMPKQMLNKQNVKASKSTLKQRLGSSKHAAKNHRKLPWMKIQENTSVEHLGGSISLHGLKSSDFKITKKKKPMKADDFQSQENVSVRIEIPENSAEFMQSVQIAYLKYVKVLNENSAKRRKYTEQGGRGPFMCSICGSSEEFVDSLSLAQHALTSREVGTRSEHLGFHKALCGLMGWTIADVPRSPWIRQIMPDDEAASLKEDLIIWPPIVIVHNSSIARQNPDERLLVSIEGLWDILKGLGFGQWMTNVCRGKAANQSTMVVAFKGTFTGLQEALRLHKFYAENTHGRREFEQIVSGDANESKAGQEISADIREGKAEGQEIPVDVREGKEEGQEIPADIREGKEEGQEIPADIRKGNAEGQEIPADIREGNAEGQEVSANNIESKPESKAILENGINHVLYGYMGIASDLDKVDFETKRRSVVKSKKEIEAIAGASLEPE